ncbi:cysteine hydrolase [Sporosarcina sp. Marseille-Q4063]|uniref:cysteine hydrolase family protein n=1 Tax=Sporosarcina sp. Marseille-Q4063 TaxID=2810514 RepID=UPI001BAE98C1|nr:cysteine hydrolase family protein [Sporosarcina sp. Marseille-Q4063]QUW20272.1 cysteine hydrolase [Sporosarcina sp. Marseille-Q4063]
MKKTALLIIDVQNGMFTKEDSVYNSEQILFNIKHLIVDARKHNIPIFYIQHNAMTGGVLEKGTEGWKIHPEVRPTSSSNIIQKTTPDSFYKTDLHNQLQKQNIEHLVLTGIQSEICVDTTCRRAFSLGYEVTLVSDAHSTWDSAELSAQQIINHHNQLLKWFATPKETKDILFDESYSHL